MQITYSLVNPYGVHGFLAGGGVATWLHHEGEAPALRQQSGGKTPKRQYSTTDTHHTRSTLALFRGIIRSH